MSILNILSPITAHTDVQVSILTLSLAEFFSFLEIFTAYMTFLTLTSGSDFLAYISVTPSPFLAEILKATILKEYTFQFLVATFFPSLKKVLFHLTLPHTIYCIISAS